MNSKVFCAVVAVLAGASAAASAAEAVAQDDSGANGPALNSLAEVLVTAQRRSQNIQDVPISMQALTGQTLKDLNITTLDDYIKFLPNVTAASNGPGQNEVFMRGLSAGSQASQGSGTNGLWPNVAIYLDNQSGQLPNRNLDIYAADLNRIEVLEGPQGTLYGAGAEAGAIRYITNEPKLNVTEGNVTGSYGVTAHGDPNTKLTAVLNLPLVADHLAARAVIYNDRRGGYIDNVPATFTRKNTDIGIHYANYPAINGQCPDGLPNSGYCVPPGSPVINNYSIAGKAINPVTYQGTRVELLAQLNDDWNALITQSYQNMDAQGVFYDQPNASDGAPLSPLEVTLFNPALDKDRFESTSLTINGKIGDLKAVYTGGYLDRNVEQVGDYTNYARGVYADYYQCYGPGSGGDLTLASSCYSPGSVWRVHSRNAHLQQELRLSTPSDWRLRAIVGAYWEDNRLYEQTNWMYKTVPTCTSNGPAGSAGNSGCLSAIGTVPGATVQYPGVLPPNSAYYQDTMRQTRQAAFFASVDYDLVPKVLTITLGTRHFRFDNSMVGSYTPSFGCFEAGAPPGGCTALGTNLNAADLRDSESGFKSRGNLTWHVTPSVMVYYTYSQGFRPGGFNENGGTLHAYGPDGVPQYVLPKAYVSDQLTNNEVGWKTEFAHHRLQWNGAIYRENWDNVQIEFFNPGIVGNLFYDANGQNFLIKGIETSLNARVLAGLTVQAAASWNRSRQTNSPALIDNNPASVGYGKPITQICSSAGTGCTPVTNPFGPIGAPSADAPPVQFSVRARYDWALSNDYMAFAQVGVTHDGHAFTQAGSNPTIGSGAVSTSRLRFEIPAYTTYDASVGISKDRWDATVYGENLSNSHASTFTSTDQFIVAQTPLRPRVLGLTVGYRF
jgi:iron complex outermembrane receptor protein